MENQTHIQGNQNIVIQGVTGSTITVSVNGEIREIQNQLSELKALLAALNAQKVQYAEKIYNIERIDEANFGFVTGKKAFNEHLTRRVIEAVAPHCAAAQRFLERVANIPDWETQLRISDKAKEIIAYSLVGVIGIQWSKLVAIGKEDFSEAKQRKYIEKSLHIARHTLDLFCFALLSRLWDTQKQRPSLVLDAALRQRIEVRLAGGFEPTLPEQFELLKALCLAFADPRNGLKLPIPELANMANQWQENSALQGICQALHTLNEKLDRSQYDLLDCFEAESQLGALLCLFPFLVSYQMASIKYIGYRQLRNDQPAYLHRFAALGIDSKAQQDAEKIRYTSDTVHTDAVLLYRGDNYQDNVVLSPFVIDFNALTGEAGAKICFFRNQPIDGEGLEYLFLENHSIERVESQGVLRPGTDISEILLHRETTSAYNLDCVAAQFRDAQQCLLGDGLDLSDL
jgi:hypothetical protein